jgi:hypothetical protein
MSPSRYRAPRHRRRLAAANQEITACNQRAQAGCTTQLPDLADLDVNLAHPRVTGAPLPWLWPARARLSEHERTGPGGCLAVIDGLRLRMSARPALPVIILANKGPALNPTCYPAAHNHLIYAAMDRKKLSFRAAQNGRSGAPSMTGPTIRLPPRTADPACTVAPMPVTERDGAPELVCMIEGEAEGDVADRSRRRSADRCPAAKDFIGWQPGGVA